MNRRRAQLQFGNHISSPALMSPPYKYFAFISYSRKDSRAATWLQKRLEWFRFPIKLVPESQRPPDPRYVRPIYRDKTNLEVTDADYWTNIRRALDESRFLIVLASPSSANSQPVEMEVSHFLTSHEQQSSLVVPIILSGSVTSVGEDAALCPSLRALGKLLTSRNLPMMVPDTDVQEQDAWEQGFVALASYLLALDIKAVGDHIQRETKLQAKVLQRWLAAVVALGLLAIFGGVVAWAQTKEAQSKNAALKMQLQEAARSDQLRAQDLLKQGRAPEALAHLARAQAYTPESTLAPEMALPILNQWDFPLPVLVLQTHEPYNADEPYSYILDAQFSPDGQRIVTASQDKTARLWDAHTGKLLTTLWGHAGGVKNAEFSPDGQRIVTCSEDCTARIWDATSGTLVASLKGHKNIVLDARFSPDSKRIVTASFDKTARVWDADNGKELAALKGHDGPVWSAHFSPDGLQIVTASDDKTSRVWEATSSKVLITLQGHEDKLKSAQFSRDGLRIVTASADKTARIWGADSGKLLSILQGHQDSVGSAEFSPDGQRIITTSVDSTAKLWDSSNGSLVGTIRDGNKIINRAHFSPNGELCIVTFGDTVAVKEAHTGRLVALLQGHAGVVMSAEFSSDGQHIVTGSTDNTARVWDVRRERLLASTLQARSEAITGGQFSPDGKRIATPSDGNTARIWEINNGKVLATLEGHEDVVWDVQFSGDGQRIVTRSADNSSRVWDAASGKLLSIIKNTEGVLWRARPSPDGRLVVTVSNDDASRVWEARVWDAANGNEIAVLKGHTDIVTTANFSPDSRQIVTASMDKTARIWEALTGKMMLTLKGHGDEMRKQEWRHGGEVCSAEFSPDGRSVVTASFDHTARVWDAMSGALLTTMKGHNWLLSGASFSPDGRRIVTTSSDMTARVWEAGNGKLLTTLGGHEGKVTDAEFSADSRRVVTSASMDKVARLWDAESGQILAFLEGHGSDVTSARFSADNSLILTTSKDGTARIWELLGTPAPPPPWFVDFLRLVAQRKFDAEGRMVIMPADEFVALRIKLERIVDAERSRYAAIARWFLTPSDKRSPRPGKE